ncbi:MAG: 50S ribosomal protein L15 [Myxococcales bacterium]|nr:50S ribosomal protein L15 [Myxococcales bacterium]
MADSDTDIPLLSRLRAPAGAVKRRRRVGRGPGSGLGKTCGKGQKGQKSRSGGSIHPWFEGGQTPLQRRLPKIGFNNPFAKKIETVNVGSLGRFESGAAVGPEELLAAGLIRKRYDGIKILGHGSLEQALTVKAHAFSAGARKAIEAAGGTVELLGDKPKAEAAPETTES